MRGRKEKTEKGKEEEGIGEGGNRKWIRGLREEIENG